MNAKNCDTIFEIDVQVALQSVMFILGIIFFSRKKMSNSMFVSRYLNSVLLYLEMSRKKQIIWNSQKKKQRIDFLFLSQKLHWRWLLFHLALGHCFWPSWAAVHWSTTERDVGRPHCTELLRRIVSTLWGRCWTLGPPLMCVMQRGWLLFGTQSQPKPLQCYARPCFMITRSLVSKMLRDGTKSTRSVCDCLHEKISHSKSTTDSCELQKQLNSATTWLLGGKAVPICLSQS